VNGRLFLRVGKTGDIKFVSNAGRIKTVGCGN
jgi:hypothetical protein